HLNDPSMQSAQEASANIPRHVSDGATPTKTLGEVSRPHLGTNFDGSARMTSKLECDRPVAPAGREVSNLRVVDKVPVVSSPNPRDKWSQGLKGHLQEVEKFALRIFSR